ncbi:FadR family transcriptional regulator [Paraglaciecola aquimarina]|uniref:FadR family transcriptional regulator n=1 Tax=Paraglaciecola algarum TaxID=3050085 RepID=A0ABS9DBK8_9ALTE|nr:FadR/GntR family transcriptional regulator [Paraglaciecola sp. G1-23]MCF2950343.1 FadR family transcriptional regulator [Paraglaciecola sp. G1-23]
MATFQLARVQKSGGLTTELVESLRAEILKGNFKTGDKLPSSKIIEQQSGVSRSVVREAIAQLKAEGLVDSKQGVGVFVTSKKNTQSFQITKAEFESIHNAIQILELRMSVEVEMGAMAAVKRSDDQMQNITNCMLNMENKISQGEDSIAEDFAFHKAIADASGNPYFRRFIDYIGSGVIPAREMITNYENGFGSDKLLAVIQEEHRQICRAIESQDSDLARASIKAHLGNSIKRHSQIEESFNINQEQ